MEFNVTICKWDKHNPRKDVKRPSWFALDNRLVEDDDFFGFNHGEFKAWIYILSKASQKHEAHVRINTEAAQRKSNISTKDFRSAIEKLERLGMVTVDVTDTSRARHADVTLQTNKQDNTNKTIHDSTPTTPPADFDFELVYKIYPLKKGKSKGIEKLKREIQTLADYEALNNAVLKYAESVKGSDPKFIKHFSTFVSEWRDWADPEAGTSTVKAAPSVKEVQDYWTDEAHNIFKALRDFGPKAKDRLGEVRWSWVKAVGGYETVNRIKYDEFGVRKLADQLKQASSMQEGA